MDNTELIELRNELADIGISATTEIADINTKGKRIFKVDEKLASQINQVMKSIPQICLEANNSSDIYRVSFDKGLGSLQKVAGKSDVYRGAVVNSGGKYAGGVEMTHLSATPQVIGGIFTAMSLVTGQYYLSTINKSLKKIEQEVHEVYQFLENDKKSKLIANEEFLKGIQQNIESISNNSIQQVAVVTTLYNIRQSAMADIGFYRMEINGQYARYTDKTKADEVIEINKKLGQNIYQYWYAVYIYCFASYLEPIVSVNNERSYLDNIIDNMSQRFKEFSESFYEVQNKMKYYIENTKGFETNKVLSKVTELLNHEPDIVIAPIEASLIILAATANAAEKHDKKKVGERVTLAKSIPEISEIKKDMDTVDLFRKQLGLYNSLYNSRLELINIEEGMYIKYN